MNTLVRSVAHNAVYSNPRLCIAIASVVCKGFVATPFTTRIVPGKTFGASNAIPSYETTRSLFLTMEQKQERSSYNAPRMMPSQKKPGYSATVVSRGAIRSALYSMGARIKPRRPSLARNVYSYKGVRRTSPQLHRNKEHRICRRAS
jgi:hypothetical protein